MSEVEYRAFIEMAMVAGARNAFVYAQPNELSDEQIRTMHPKSEIIAVERQQIAWR